jgi:hypothetical protein
MQGQIRGFSWSDRELDKRQQQASSAGESLFRDGSVTSATSGPIRQHKPPCKGTVYVTIESCEDLVPTARSKWDFRADYDTSHPYVAASMTSVDDDLKQMTNTVEQSLAPDFDLVHAARAHDLPVQAQVNKTAIKFPIDPYAKQHMLYLGAWSRNTWGKDVFLGERTIDLWDAFDEDWGKAKDGQFSLKDPSKLVLHEYRMTNLKLNRRGLGHVQIKLFFVRARGAPIVNRRSRTKRSNGRAQARSVAWSEPRSHREGVSKAVCETQSGQNWPAQVPRAADDVQGILARPDGT